jgi:hypothetical protein
VIHIALIPTIVTDLRDGTIHRFATQSAAARFAKVSPKNLNIHLNESDEYTLRHWCFARDNSCERVRHRKGKYGRVKRIERATGEEVIFPSPKDAAEATHYSYITVLSYINGQIKGIRSEFTFQEVKENESE